MNIFISGGCKNGKSLYAQELAKSMAEKEGQKLYYLATMKPVDEEDLARIARHVEERKDWGFITIEQDTNICDCLCTELNTNEDKEEKKASPDGIFLLDSVTALLSNEMFKHDGSIDLAAPKRVASSLEKFAKLTGNTIFVSDYIYGDTDKYDEITEAYRKGLAFIDKTLARLCPRVIEVAMGNTMEYKEF